MLGVSTVANGKGSGFFGLIDLIEWLVIIGIFATLTILIMRSARRMRREPNNR